MIRRLMTVALGMLGLVGCADHEGPLQLQTRDVGTFTSIDMEGAAWIEITVGVPASVQIEAPSAALERIKSEVRSETLFLRSKPRDWLPGNEGPRIRLKVGVPRLQSLRIGGGNEVRLHGFSGGESRIEVEGAVHLNAQGELDRLNVRMAGAGHADFSKLVAKDTQVMVEGVGTVLVHPTQKLDATMNGIGAIYYSGNPSEVSTRMNGLGTISKQDSEPSGAPEEEPEEIDPDTLQPEYERTV